MTGRRPATQQLSVLLRTFASESEGGWERLGARACAADAAGIDRLVLSDHVAFGADLSAYADPSRGGVAGGRQPTGPDGQWLEPLITIAFLAGQTSSVRFGTSVLQAALRRSVVLAKSAATLDVLSAGRLDLGVGVGWQRAEYKASGLDFDRRGDLLDDTLAVCRTLWTETAASHDSEHLSFEEVHQMPKPVQSGGVPVWVSGTVQPRAMRRLARFGSGWIPWGPDAADVGGGIERMRHAVGDLGRDPAGIEVAGTLPVVRDARGDVDVAATMARVPELADAGVTDFRIGMAVPEDPAIVEDVMGEIVAGFRSVWY